MSQFLFSVSISHTRFMISWKTCDRTLYGFIYDSSDFIETYFTKNLTLYRVYTICLVKVSEYKSNACYFSILTTRNLFWKYYYNILWEFTPAHGCGKSDTFIVWLSYQYICLSHSVSELLLGRSYVALWMYVCRLMLHTTIYNDYFIWFLV